MPHRDEPNVYLLKDILPDQPNVVVALACASIGWRVLPLATAGGRVKPAIKNWPDEATTDRNLIMGWWGWRPDWKVGIATGLASGIWVLDIDVKRGVNGFATIRNVCAEHGVTHAPATFRVRTPSGGEHWYFTYPDDDREIVNTVSRVGRGVDSRGRNGYVVAPSTWTLRGTYEVVDEHVPIAAWPWLEGMVLKRAYVPVDVPGGATIDYARSALNVAAQRLSGTRQSQGRNNALNLAALQLGELGALGVLDREAAWSALRDACRSNGLLEDDGERQCRATFESGWNAGANHE
jgi:hypothetical protein